MNRAIFKYELPIDDEWHQLVMPLPARVYHVAVNHMAVTAATQSSVYLWAEVSPSGKKRGARLFRVFGTGQDIPEGAVYVGTTLDGPFVWHVYVGDFTNLVEGES